VAHDLLALSARIIDEQVVDEPFNRVNQQLSLVADDIAVVESFSNAITVRTAGGLVVLDASSAATGPAVVEALRPLYDEPEFVVHNIWRLYGGWWDGNPAHLHPPGERAVATEVAELAGDADTLARRAEQLAAAGDLRLAGQLAEWAAQAAPHNPAVQRIRAALYEQRQHQATSLMAKGIYGAARRQAKSATPDHDAAADRSPQPGCGP